MQHRYTYEYTDTYGGEANYDWVRRGAVRVPLASDETRKERDLVTARAKAAAKRAVGLSGIRGTWDEYGDTMEFRPRGMCTVLFVEWESTI